MIIYIFFIDFSWQPIHFSIYIYIYIFSCICFSISSTNKDDNETDFSGYLLYPSLMGWVWNLNKYVRGEFFEFGYYPVPPFPDYI